jgi:hypothetical protein
MPYVRAAHANLGPQRFALTWARGQELTLEAACAVASARTGLHPAVWSEGRAPTFEHVIDRALKRVATLVVTA